MALLFEIFEERVAAAMAAPSGGCCHDLAEQAACHLSPASTSGSTRASSPGGDSSTSSWDASCGIASPGSKPNHIGDGAGTLAQRRGIRAAILGELGVDLDDKARGAASVDTRVVSCGTPTHSLFATPHGIHMGTPSGMAAPTQLIATRPVSGPRTPAMDASQRSPMFPRGISQMSSTHILGFKPSTPSVNSRIARNCLGSSPSSSGDASQRSLTGNCKASPVGGTSWNNAIASVLSTRSAAIASKGVASANGQMDGRTNGLNSVAVVSPSPVATISAHTAVSSLDVAKSGTSNHALNQLLAINGLSELSSDDLAARLRAAAPEEYED